MASERASITKPPKKRDCAYYLIEEYFAALFQLRKRRSVN
jgi:hypothetical protein